MSGTFGARLRHFILKQTADREGVAALDQHVGIERAGIDHRTGHGRSRKVEERIADLVADLRLYRQRDEIVFVDRRLHDQRVAKFLVLESAEDGRGGLFVEIQLRHRLITDDLDLRLHVVCRNDARVREEFSVGILVQGLQCERHLGNRQDGELACSKFAKIPEETWFSVFAQA